MFQRILKEINTRVYPGQSGSRFVAHQGALMTRAPSNAYTRHGVRYFLHTHVHAYKGLQ